MAAPARRLLTVFLAGSLGIFGCSKTPEEVPSGAPAQAASGIDPNVKQPQAQRPPPAIIFLGDSLTAGLGLPERQAFPALIENELKKSGADYAVINAGRSGDTTAGGLARLDWYLKDRVNPQILVIFLGSNDAMRGVPPSAMEKNLRAIIKKARDFRPELKILLAELRTFPNLGANYGEQFLALFARVAKEEKVELIGFPLENVAGHSELNQADGVHPNRAGTEKVAEAMWKALEPHLGKPRPHLEK